MKNQDVRIALDVVSGENRLKMVAAAARQAL